MFSITGRNVNEVMPIAMMNLAELADRNEITPSRNGLTVEFPTPVASVYLRPDERVIFVPERDANPFFHFFESLWILAGWEGVEWLAYFNKNIRNYSDDGWKFHGAYGARMRNMGGVDQIAEVVSMLVKYPHTRRAVIQIWDATRDLNKNSKDIPCNDLIVFKARGDGSDNPLSLDMTVYNRSNDAIWGAYGANVVHFSVLHEYIASAVGMELGRYTQVSNSLHAYIDNPQWHTLKNVSTVPFADPYAHEVSPYPLFNMTQRSPMGMLAWDMDLHTFMRSAVPGMWITERFDTPFFTEVAKPMWNAWVHHKIDRTGLLETGSIMAEDWRLAATEWLRKRELSND